MADILAPPVEYRASRRRVMTAGDSPRRPNRLDSNRRTMPPRPPVSSSQQPHPNLRSSKEPHPQSGSSYRVLQPGNTGSLPVGSSLGPAPPPPRPTITRTGDVEAMPLTRPLPSDEVLNALFERMTARMNLKPERLAELNSRNREQKWSLILAQHEIQAGIACVFYIEQLVRHTQPELKEKRPKKKLLENLQPLAKVLADLEVDLRTNPNDSWVQEFVNMPNHGHVALIDLIKDLADNPYSVPRKNPRKYALLERDPSLLYTGLLCLKALMSHRRGFSSVLSYDPSLCVLAYCLSSQTTRGKVLILKLMVSVLLAPGGHRKVLQAFDYFRAVMKERMRFQLLIASLTQEPVEPAYQAACLCFLNTVVQTAHGTNAKVFHQHEFLEAGFSPVEVEKTLHGRQDERVLHELREWQNNSIDVQHYMDNLAVARGRARNLKEELESTQRHLHEANIDRETLYEQTRRLLEKHEQHREKISKLNESINELLEVKLQRDELLQENTQLQEANQRYRLHTSELKERVDTLVEENKVVQVQQEQLQEMEQKMTTLQHFVEGATQTSDSLIQLPQIVISGPSTIDLTAEATDAPPPRGDIPVAPPPPPIMVDGAWVIPPAPPLPLGVPMAPPVPPIGGGFPGFPIKKPVIPNVPLPMLNWIPIKNPEYTIFKDMDDEGVIETVDFSEFEALFQVKRFKKTERTTKREETLKKLSEQLCLIESRRARNLVIAKRRIGHNARTIMEFILNTDLDGLLPEHCDLLLKFIPTQEELTELAKHAHRFDEFGEAERFMYQLAKIERYESRLSAMGYMGSFDELINTAQPQINAVLSASLSVFRSTRLKKVFEIILAFGNYMNSSRRGAVYGFKLESLNKLLDTKSLDRKQTLLHYIVHVVEMIYPNVLSFYEDLYIEEACTVSFQILSEDMNSLKKGLEDVQFEMEKEPDNFIVFSFYKHAHRKVAHLAETYAKTEDAYREVCLMFSESPKTMDPSDFFSYFNKFVTEWKKAVQDNHVSKRRKMRPAVGLLKKHAEEEDAKDTLAELAAEVAATAAARTEHIREETQKIAEKKAGKKEEEEVRKAERVPGEVVSSPKEEIHDIRNREVHRMDLKERLPWLKEVAERKAQSVTEEAGTGEVGFPVGGERGGEPGERDVASPDSGVMEQLSDAGLDSDGTNVSPEHTHATTRRDQLQGPEDIPVQFQNGELEHGSQTDTPNLPPRDYPTQLPPKDYPKSESRKKGVAQDDLFGDDDYYTQMLTAAVN